jgi:16S rRNA G966 N2-methylase RsmD
VKIQKDSQYTLSHIESSKIFDMSSIGSPVGYKGLAAFHKYWGKKPAECFSFLIELLTSPDELIIDPFVGSGFVAREALLRQRRFIGIDLNPIAIQHTNLLVDLPSAECLQEAFQRIENSVRTQIEQTYKMIDGKIATHYLWEKDNLKSVWCITRGKGNRDIRLPVKFDIDIYNQYQEYQSKFPRKLKQFYNSRINSTDSLSLKDLFTGRALHNIDLILESIYSESEDIQRALLLSLTAGSGQMSRMVFAITKRGKTNGAISEKIEVGSWVIGYWRPILHFEINVWNCFRNRVLVLLKVLSNENIDIIPANFGGINEVITGSKNMAILNDDARAILDSIPPEVASLIVTDPPHSDRIPYLELSDMWNSLLRKEVVFDKEIVVSNAKGREKTKNAYLHDMTIFLEKASKVLKPGKFLALLFNARDDKSWVFLKRITSVSSELIYKGSFPMLYSANSVVQDNRKGSLKTDFVLLFQKVGGNDKENEILAILEKLPGWSTNFPQ